MGSPCPDCGTEYSKLGSHLAQSDCEYPGLTDHQHEIVTGTLMGDGDIKVHSDAKNPIYRVRVIDKPYLEYIDSKMGHHTTGVSLSIERDGYNDLWAVRSIASPIFEQYRNWYSSGEKQFPEDIKLTPTVLKHWFCCDGHRNINHDYIKITATNEKDNEGKIRSMFNRVGFEINNWSISENSSGEKKCDILFTINESARMWEYMGSPPPGFEYKWPDRFM
jgi:hypothetical protein